MSAATAEQRVHEFMEYRRRVLRLRMGESSGAGELALLTELLRRIRATPERADIILESGLHFTPAVLELKAHSSFWATFEMKDRSLALAQRALRSQCVAEHEVVSSHALVADHFAATTRILQRYGAFALKPVIGELGSGVLTVRAWDARSNRPATSALGCDSPLAQFHLYTPAADGHDEQQGWFRTATAALGMHKHGETLADKEGAEPLYETLRSWVQGTPQGLTRDCFTTETDDGERSERWLVEQLTPTLDGFGPFELRVFVLGGVATCVVFG